MTTDETRMSIEHMAATMYANRVKEDKTRGKGTLYENNPDARALYFKGIHDTLACLEVWMQGPPNMLGMFLEALANQTTNANAGH